MLKPHVVILGAGFGGTYVAKKLAKHVKRGLIDVTIVNKTNYFLFTPLLHEVATGSLSPTSVAEPLREVFAGTGVELCQGSVQSIDMAERQVIISGVNGPRYTLPYDYLVIATGAETNYYGISGAEKYALPLKELNDAVRIRSQIINCFEEAVMCEDPTERARLLTFVVVGGGPTGVETVGELNDFVHGISARYFCNNQEFKLGDTKVILVHAGAELLQQFPQVFRKSALDRLCVSGVDVRLDSAVNNITSHTISFENGGNIPTRTVIWTAGVKPSKLDFGGANGSNMASAGRVTIDEYFRVDSDERTFALGDTAVTLAMLAQVAVGQAAVVAKNIIASIKLKELKKFTFQSKGIFISVGQWFAIGSFSLFGGISNDKPTSKIQGRFAWWVWRTIYISKFASTKKRIRSVFEWTLELFFPRDITKLI